MIAKYVEKLRHGGSPVMTRLTPAEAGLRNWTTSSGRSATSRPAARWSCVDDADRENEGDLIFAAARATPELMAFTIRYTSGVICVPLPGADLDRLALPLMTAQNHERMRTAFTVSVDAADGVTTGISAADRAPRPGPARPGVRP